MGVLNSSKVDTTPGVNADDPFCPPAGFEGSAEEYMALCRYRIKDLMYGQRMISISRFAARPSNPIEIKGPYAAQVQQFIVALQKPSTEEQTSLA